MGWPPVIAVCWLTNRGLQSPSGSSGQSGSCPPDDRNKHSSSLLTFCPENKKFVESEICKGQTVEQTVYIPFYSTKRYLTVS